MESEMSEPQSYKRCISCGKAFPHTHPGIMLGVYWACCAECNSNDDNRNKKPTCCMCEREIKDHMKPQFIPNGEEQITFCGSYCAQAYSRGRSGWGICDQVTADINHRRVTGQIRYGRPLDWEEDKDYLYEAYEEALDMVIYLKAALVKRDSNAGRNTQRPASAGLFAATGN
jgi:hypothetical protein